MIKINNPKLNGLTFIDLFAGLGGFRLALESCGAKCIYSSEWDKYAQEVYKMNFKDTPNGDITKVNEKTIPEHDILCAGFPCQAFSVAGFKKGFDDIRGTLFFDIVRIAKYHKPKVIFCENVKNLVTHDNGKTFKRITEILKKIGYKVYSEVINSKNFGVPQNRERVYIVAFRKNINSSNFIFPIKKDDSKKIVDILEKKEVSPKYYLSDVYLECLRNHKQRHRLKGNGFGYEIRDKNEIARTLVCGGIGRERNLIVDKKLTNFNLFCLLRISKK